jgi:hypothetical protein
MPDEPLLRDQARQAVEREKLPNRSPNRVWGGPGLGGICIICDKSIVKTDMEFELDFVTDDTTKTHHLHARCYSAWELVRSKPEGDGRRPRKAK